tara:strand:+ start:1880 stop:2839 length:960 start_codon:yes stop_codon:yes gene_type:complete
MKDKISIIAGGSGQLGVYLSRYLLKKGYKIIITTRNIKLARKKIPFKNRNLTLTTLNVLKKKEIKKIILKYRPKIIFYFASQSSPKESFANRVTTINSNFVGCKNFLEFIQKQKIDCKFVNASSSEIFSETKKKINLKSKKTPISPYGKAKLMSYRETKYFREKKKIKAYNAIIFNTESFLRKKDFLIPKICIAAINAYKFNTKTAFGNLDVSREWNWCEEQVKYLMYFVSNKPQDFILSNGKPYTAKKMLSFAFKYFKLDYRKFVSYQKNLLRKKDFKLKKSDYISCLKRNKIKRISKIYGKSLIHALIKHYLNEKKN